MPILAVAAVVWIGVHIGLSGTSLRVPIAARLGERAFRALFSVVSVAALAFLIVAFVAAPRAQLWVAPGWLRDVLALVMLAAFLLFAGAVTVRNPTMIGPGDPSPEAPRGTIRVTRHPMLWSFVLWACVHLIGVGTVAGVLFFGALLVTPAWGMPSIDGKLAARNQALWAMLAPRTSILPFGAILRGRNRFISSEINWFGQLVAILVWAALLAHGHHWLFGVSPLAGGP
jgi:uncharacterized membrane protein